MWGCHLIGNLTFDLFMCLEYVSGSQRVTHSSFFHVFINLFIFLKKLYNIVGIGEMYVQMLSDIAFEFCAFDPMVT